MRRRFVLIVTLVVIAALYGERLEPAQAAPSLAGVGSGPIGTPFQITNGSNDQTYPAIAYNSQDKEYLVVYQYEWSGGKNIVGRRVSASGALPDSPFGIYGGTSGYSADVTYNSQTNQYLVVWEHDGGAFKDVRGRLVSATGQLLGTELTIAAPGMAGSDRIQPSVGYASTVNKYLVVYTYDAPSPLNDFIQAISLNSDGSAAGSYFDVGGGTDNSGQPDLAYNHRRNEFLVAYEITNGGYKGISARRVTMAGTPAPVGSEFVVSGPLSDQTAPSVGVVPRSPDGQFMVAWESKLPTGNKVVFENLYSGTGTSEGLLYLPSTAESNTSPAVAGNEKAGQYLLAMTRTSKNGSLFFNDIHMAMIPSKTFDPWGREAGVGEIFANNPAVASGPYGDFLVAYQSIGNGTDIYGQLWGNRQYLPLLKR